MYNELRQDEKKIYDYIPQILGLINADHLKSIIYISETIQPDVYGDTALGCWDHSKNGIIIRRDQLKSLEDLSGTLIHEVIHANEGLSDVSRDFESSLTKHIGKLASIILNNKNTHRNKGNWWNI